MRESKNATRFYLFGIFRVMGNIKQIGPILVKKMREESGTTFKIWYGTMVAQKASPRGRQKTRLLGRGALWRTDCHAATLLAMTEEDWKKFFFRADATKLLETLRIL